MEPMRSNLCIFLFLFFLARTWGSSNKTQVKFSFLLPNTQWTYRLHSKTIHCTVVHPFSTNGLFWITQKKFWKVTIVRFYKGIDSDVLSGILWTSVFFHSLIITKRDIHTSKVQDKFYAEVDFQETKLKVYEKIALYKICICWYALT